MCTEMLATICPRPVICKEAVMESWRIVCVLERVVFLAHPFFFSMFCHASCLSLYLPPSLCLSPLPAFSVPHFSEGWLQRMNAQVTARRNYGNAAPVISERCKKLYGNAQQPTTGSFKLSSHLLLYSYVLLPPYLSFHSIHVIVRYLKLSHQQIHPKIIGGGLPVSRHCAVYE